LVRPRKNLSRLRLRQPQENQRQVHIFGLTHHADGPARTAVQACEFNR
jgi:hypothetical protein